LRQLRRAQERPPHRPQSQDGRGGADQSAPRPGLSRLARAEGPDQRDADQNAAGEDWHRLIGPVVASVAGMIEGDIDARRPAKSAAAFRTISEVAQELEVPQHVLRFWESKFNQIRPLKRGGGRRYYRPEDVALLRRIRQCLYDDGYTIKGVQRLLRE